MYYYKIGHRDYEHSQYFEFLHKKEFTKQQFEDIFVEVVTNVILKIDTKNWKSLILSITFEDNLYECEEIRKIMVEKYGFEEIQYTQQIEVRGETNLVSRKGYMIEEQKYHISNRISKKYWRRKNNSLYL